MLHIWTVTFVIAVYIHTSYFESFIVTVVHVSVMSTKNDWIISITSINMKGRVLEEVLKW